ncbi:MAG: NAD(P)/FAD-dependent oxidoreductase [Pirellulaceae bacterium]
MSTKQFDLIVLGSGPAGSSIAKESAAMGHRVAAIESREFGGTCALRGCNPKKVYVNASAAVDRVRRGDGRLVNDQGVTIDWKQLHDFKRQFTQPVRERSRQSFDDAGIDTFVGSPRFLSPDRLTVGGNELVARRIAISTGARPRPLEFEGEEFVIGSDTFLDLETMPRQVVFIGGGYVSMEFAHVVARYGADVRVVERGDRLLAGFDPDLTSLLQSFSESVGIRFSMNAEVCRVTKLESGKLRVWLKNTGAGKESLDCDLVVHGAGRIPNLQGLDLGAGNVDVADDGVCVNEYFQSQSNHAVFAAGDCAASAHPKLTPSANEQARIVIKNLFSDSFVAIPKHHAIPIVAFTTPAIASIGLSEVEARQRVDNLSVRFDDVSTWGSVRKTGETVAAYKVLIDESNDRIVGAHLLGPAAEETINLFALAMSHQLTASDLKSTLFSFPTFASDVRRMLG